MSSASNGERNQRIDFKDSLPRTQDAKHFLDASTSATTHGKARWLVLLFLSLYILFRLPRFLKTTVSLDSIQGIAEPACPQASSIHPSLHEHIFHKLDELFQTETFRESAYESLGAAVRVPTVTFDEEKAPSEDPSHWKVYDDFHSVLEQQFPLIHLNLNVTKVNLYALVYEWPGQDTSLKPILLTGHQDVVPISVDTLSQWNHPPFSGLFDGEFIWGRGSCDDKSGLIASMTAVETLLAYGFKPQRTLVLAYGIDEERGGVYGATAIRDFLLQKYGENAFAMLVDEGGGYSEKFGAIISTPAVAEKGKLDVRIQISTPGGHSSIPPAHTSIGMLSRIITAVEDNPHPTSLRRDGVYYQQMQCIAEHAPSIPQDLKELIQNSYDDDEALEQLATELDTSSREFKPSTGTTQAVDIIGGGVKSNALPEEVFAVVNHRIADYSSVSDLEERFTNITAPFAKAFNLTFDAFGSKPFSTLEVLSSGHLRLSDAYGTGLNPAPVTPTTGSAAWDLLSGSILFAFRTTQRSEFGRQAIAVAPGLSLGNTDTRHYWNLTENIFRYGHLGAADRYNGAHTINEAVRGEGFVEMIRFFAILILNADETNLLG